MDVTKDNFGEAMVVLDELLSRAQFVAFDEEMTGIELSTHREMLVETMQSRYTKKCAVASKFGMIQFGLSVFTYEEGKEGEGEYVAHPFNFYVFPDESKNGGVDPLVTLSASAIAFNRRCGMNWSKWIGEGVTYANKLVMSQYDKKAKEELEKNLGINVPLSSSQQSSIKPSEPRPITLTKESDVETIKSMLDGFNEWFESIQSSTETEKTYEFPACNSFLRLALILQLKNECKYVPASNETTHNAALAEVDNLKKKAEELRAKAESLRTRVDSDECSQPSPSQDTDEESVEKNFEDRIEKLEKRAQSADESAEAEKAKPICDPERVVERMPFHIVIDTKSGEDFRSSCVIAKVLTVEEREKYDAEMEIQRQQKRDRVFGASALLSLFEKHKITLVGHNCVYDILFMFAGFKELPASLTEFSSLYRRIIHRTFDTKLLYSSSFYLRLPFAVIVKAHHLGLLYEAFLAAQVESQKDSASSKQEDGEQMDSSSLSAESKPLQYKLPSVFTGPKAIRFAEGFTKYTESSALFHEAGYDAFCTGFVFLHLAYAFGTAAKTAMPYYPKGQSPVYPLSLKIDYENTSNVMGEQTKNIDKIAFVRPVGPFSSWCEETPTLLTLANQVYMMKSLYCMRFVSESEASKPLLAIQTIDEEGIKAEWLTLSLSAPVTEETSMEESESGSDSETKTQSPIEKPVQSWIAGLLEPAKALESRSSSNDPDESIPDMKETYSIRESLLERMHSGLMLGHPATEILVLMDFAQETNNDDISNLLGVSPSVIKWNDSKSLFIFVSSQTAADELKLKIDLEFAGAEGLNDEEIIEKYPLGVWKLKDYHTYASDVLKERKEYAEQNASKRVKMA